MSSITTRCFRKQKASCWHHKTVFRLGPKSEVLHGTARSENPLCSQLRSKGTKRGESQPVLTAALAHFVVFGQIVVPGNRCVQREQLGPVFDQCCNQLYLGFRVFDGKGHSSLENFPMVTHVQLWNSVGTFNQDCLRFSKVPLRLWYERYGTPQVIQVYFLFVVACVMWLNEVTGLINKVSKTFG